MRRMQDGESEVVKSDRQKESNNAKERPIYGFVRVCPGRRVKEREREKER